MSAIAIERFGPARTWARPGDTVVAAATVRSSAGTTEALVQVSLLDLDRVVGCESRTVILTETAQVVEFHLTLPPQPRHGYGLRLEVERDGATHAATSAVEALAGWWESPRHAAVTEYVDVDEAASAAAELSGWGVNVVQHYDWMWRHYRYRPPDGASVFEDALGRTVSHDALRASIAAGHHRGIASLAYGSVYGAEPEHVEDHPDDRVFDEDGEPLSLGGTFYINDVRPGSAWRARLLEQYRDAVTSFDFDGIHMDTYGQPHRAVAADGEHIDLAALYPGLIDEASALVARSSPGARVLFNCVDGFPVESVAPAEAAALYLELWPPDDTFADVVGWIDRARGLAGGRQVVIAAYAATLKEPVSGTDRPAAFEAAALLGSIITVAGGYHHTLAEGGRLLVEGYYPAAVRMTPPEIEELRALWRFGARYVHLLSAPGLKAEEPSGLEIHDAQGRVIPWSELPSAGSIWVRATCSPDGTRALHLVDLRSQTDERWTHPKAVAPAAGDLRLRWPGVGAVTAASPWSDSGDAVALPAGDELELPEFRRWLQLVAI